MNRLQLFVTILSLIALSPGVSAGEQCLTLDSCRNLAISNNKELRSADMQIKAAQYNSKAAFTAYLPKVSASGLYLHTGKELSLLSDEQKSTLSHLGDALSVPQLNQVGQGLTDALRTDTRNIAGAAVILTQPLYMGGKIRAYNNITRYAEKIAAEQRELKYQDLIVEVDEAYWNIVALTARKRLAESYLTLVKTLDSDIQKMIAEGFATKADGLSVRVKVNEANVALIQVDNGLEILRMHLCQLCGIPLDTPVVLADETREILQAPPSDMPAESASPADCPELRALSAAVAISEEKVKVARAEFLPTVALTGGYFASYPSVFNSFEKKFKGTWNIGVAVNVPILTWNERGYKVKAAKAEAEAARFNFDETKEKIELQVSQCRRHITEAVEKYAAAESSQAAADENLRYATTGLKEGVIPVSNVIEAQTAWLSAKTTLISSDIELRLARIYLAKSLGTIK